MTTSNGGHPQVTIPAGFKDLQQEDLASIVRASAIEPEDPRNTPSGGGINMIWMLGQVADKIPAWGVNPYMRDVRLRQFYGTESFTTSAISTLVARNMGFAWRVRGDKGDAAVEDSENAGTGGGDQLVETARKALRMASHGRGWQHFTAGFSLDLMTQDRSAYMEIVREFDQPYAPMIGINHLDSLRCWATGDWQYPVLYYNRKGAWVKLPWYRVQIVSELPATIETAYGLQYCALTRVLAVAQVFKNTLQYMEEKTGGNFTNAIHVISGVTKDEVEEAITTRKFTSQMEGQIRGMIPAILATLNPEKDPKLVTLELATLPETWNLDTIWKWFTVVVAMGLWSDYGDFAPLPGNNLGSASQSETMYERSKGKGAAVYKELVENSLNLYAMPEGVTFEYWEDDPKADLAAATTGQARAAMRGVMIANNEIDEVAARQMALAAGDITQEIFDEMEVRAVERQAEEEAQREEELQLMQSAMAGNEGPASPPRPRPRLLQPGGSPLKALKARTTIPQSDSLEDRIALEDEYAARIQPALAKAGDLVKRRLRKLA